MTNLTIGQLAKASKVKISTIRYYERCGLLIAESRTKSGYRQYNKETTAKLRFIKNAQHLGFALDEVAELLRLQTHVHKNQCSSVKIKTASRLELIDKKIKSLKKMQHALNGLYDRCQGKDGLQKCPIIDALNHTDFEGLTDEG